MYGFINKILGIVLCFAMMVIMVCSVMLSDQIQARRSVVAEVTNFLDEVTDSGNLTERQVADLYLACSGYGPTCDVQLLRYVKVVNPDPKNPGSTYTTYVGSDDFYTWNQGDILKIKVTEIGYSSTSSFLYSTLGILLAPVDFTLAGRIR